MSPLPRETVQHEIPSPARHRLARYSSRDNRRRYHQANTDQRCLFSRGRHGLDGLRSVWVEVLRDAAHRPLAGRAMRFTNAYSQPLCSPTRASFLTGQYSARHRITAPSGHLPPPRAGTQVLAESAPANVAMLLPQSQKLPRAVADHFGRNAACRRLSHGAHWQVAPGNDRAALARAARIRRRVSLSSRSRSAGQLLLALSRARSRCREAESDCRYSLHHRYDHRRSGGASTSSIVRLPRP